VNLLEVRGLCMEFPGETGSLEVLDQVSFSIAPQEFISLLGPSGSGKTTILRLLAGLLQPTSGQIHYAVPEDGRKPRLGLVFQQANLMPWRTALQNILLPLEVQGVDARQARARAQEMIELTGLRGFENTWPHDLSGGDGPAGGIGARLDPRPGSAALG
jgi:NitT/TauT family transport system ATP-binding protein